MIPFRKILFPVDFSDACRKITPRVREKLARYDAELILLHAVNAAPLAVGPPEAPLFIPDASQSEIFHVREQQLRQFAAEHFPESKPVILVAMGDPNHAINETLRRQGADLIMMPTHGHGPIRRLLLGSVTSKVLHDADCAVWTMIPGSGSDPRFPYRQILCAISLDQPDSPAVLRAAGFIAQSCGAELSLIHAVDLPESGLEFSFRATIMEAAERQIRKLRLDAGVDAPYDLVIGSPVEQTRIAALKLQADLIITGRGQSRDGASRVWSHLYSIIREAPCPVLSI